MLFQVITNLVASRLTEFKIAYVVWKNNKARCVFLVAEHLKITATTIYGYRLLTFTETARHMFRFNPDSAPKNEHYQYAKEQSEMQLSDNAYIKTDDGKRDRLYSLQGKRVKVSASEDGEVRLRLIEAWNNYPCHIFDIVISETVVITVIDDRFHEPPIYIELHVNDALRLLESIEAEEKAEILEAKEKAEILEAEEDEEIFEIVVIRP
jgi:hypothetical protein